MRRPRSYCRRCDRRRARIRQARRRAENPELELERVRRSKRKRKLDREGRRRLAIEPWRQWMLDQISDLDLRGVEHPLAELAQQLGVHDRVVYAWLHERPTVQLDAVDEALCQFGDPQALRDLYPELYDNDPRSGGGRR